jgi:hypothetical protein
VRATTTFSQTLTFVIGLLYLEKRVSYRRLKKEFGLDDETLDDVRHELIVMRLAIDENGEGLFFTGASKPATPRPRHLYRPPRRSPCRRFRPRSPRRRRPSAAS